MLRDDCITQNGGTLRRRERPEVLKRVDRSSSIGDVCDGTAPVFSAFDPPEVCVSVEPVSVIKSRMAFNYGPEQEQGETVDVSLNSLLLDGRRAFLRKR